MGGAGVGKGGQWEKNKEDVCNTSTMKINKIKKQNKTIFQ